MTIPRWVGSIGVLLTTVAAAGCDVGSRYALTAQATAQEDPEVVMRRVLDIRGLDVNGDGLDDGIPLPGGRSVVFTRWTSDPRAFGNLAVVDLETRSLRQITADSSAFRYPIPTGVSRDGQWIAFWRDSGAPDWKYDVRVIRSDGTGERALLPMCCAEDIPLEWAEGRDFTPDGSALLVVAWNQDGTTHLARVSVSDGSSEIVRAFDWRVPNQVQYSPDGRWIAYDFPPEEDNRARELYVMSADGSREVRLTENSGAHSLAGWARDGSALYYLAVSPTGEWSLWRLPVRDGGAAGPVSLVRANLQHVRPGYLNMQDAGVFLTLQPPEQSLWTVPLDLEPGRLLGAPSMLVAAAGGGDGPTGYAWSPDNRSLLYARRSIPGQGWELVLHSPVTGEQRSIPLPLDAVRGHWQWDERTVIVLGEMRGRLERVRVDLASGQVQKIDDPKLTHMLEELQGPQASMTRPRISADGAVKYFTRFHEGADMVAEILAQQVESGDERVLYRGRLSGQPFISPDRSQLAFITQDAADSTAWELRVLPAAGGESRVVFTSTDGAIGGATVQWSPDGRMLLFLQRQPGRIWKVGADGTNPTLVFKSDKDDMRGLQLSPDGRRLAFIAAALGEPVHELWLIENLPEQRTVRTSTPR